MSRLPSPERTQIDAVRWNARVCAASLALGVSCAPPQDRPPARQALQAAPSAVRLPTATAQPQSAAPPDLDLDAGDPRRPAPTLRFTLETAKQAQPTFIAPGPDASVWFVESSGRLRKVSATGTVELSTVFAKGQWLLSDAASSPTGELALIGLFNELQLGGTRVPHRKDFSDFSGLRGAFVARLDNNAKPLFLRSLPSAMREVLALGEKTVLAGFGGGTAKPDAPDPIESLQGFFLAGLGKDGAAQWANSTDPGQLRASGDGFTFISSSTGSHVEVSSWSQEGTQMASHRVPYKARIDHAAAHRGQVALGFEMLASSGPPDFGTGPLPRGFGFGVAQLGMAPEPAVGWIRLFDGEAPRRFQELLNVAPTPEGGTVVATLWLHAEAAELPPDTAPPVKGVAVDLELLELDDQGHLAWSLRQLLPDSCHAGLQGQDAPTTNVTADVLVTSNRAYVAINCGMVETYAGAFGDNRAWLYGWQREPE